MTGLSPQTVPVIQQAGALALGFFVSLLCCVAGELPVAEGRISVAASLVVFSGPTVLGAFYYVALPPPGVATPGLIAILVVAIVMTIGFGFYLFKSIERV